MSRRLLYGSLVVVLLLGAGGTWLYQRRLEADRGFRHEPPPQQPRNHQNLTGRRLPAFKAVDQHGREVATAALRGRVVVINVWATWCRPCIDELPRIEREIWRRFQPDVSVIAIARGDSVEKVREFNRNMKLTFSLVGDRRQKLARQFGGDDMIPRTYVIDRSGVVVHQAIGYSERGFAEVVSAVQGAIGVTPSPAAPNPL